MSRRLRSDAGFTLLELVIAIVIMGVITIPLANFVIAYFQNYTQTEARFSESHDVQIASAYFSQDVSNLGVRSSYTSTAFQQSVWTTGFPAAFCGQSTGTALLLIKWSDPVDYTQVHSVAYVANSGTLRRVYCAVGTTNTSVTTMVHNLVYPDSGNTSPVTCSPDCSGAPTSVTLTLSIRASGDSSIWAPRPVLTAQRRQQS